MAKSYAPTIKHVALCNYIIHSHKCSYKYNAKSNDFSFVEINEYLVVIVIVCDYTCN